MPGRAGRHDEDFCRRRRPPARYTRAVRISVPASRLRTARGRHAPFVLSTAILAWALTGTLLATLLMADPASAARRKRRPPRALLNVAVLPFEGKGTGGRDGKDALELELELVETVLVVASDRVEAELRKAGRRAWEADTLASILGKRDVDVLIRAERGPGERSPDALLVSAWAADGKPRFFRELALGTEPDVAAASVVGALRPALEGWRDLRPIRLPDPGGDEEGGRLRPEDVLVDDDLGGGSSSRDGRRGRDGAPPERRKALEEPPPAEEPVKRTRKRSPLDFNEEGDDPDDRAETRSKKTRRSRFDDDGADDDRDAGDGVDESGRRRSIDDLDEGVAMTPSKRAGHVLALSGAFDGGTWYYDFDGGGTGDTTVQAPFYPGGGAVLDVWPLFFAGVDWVGVDADIAVSAVPFKIQGAGLVVTPSDFVSIQTRGGVAAKLRYSFGNGFGVGARAGYRFFGASVEAQTIDAGGQTQNLTVVPGYALHAASLGVEAFLPLRLGERRLELEAHADGLPATYYAEAPDNPGATSLGFGWSGSLAVRFEIASGFFVEGRGHSTGVTVQYSDEGKRVAFVGNQLKPLQGGNVLNLSAGFAVGVGFLW